MGDMDGLFFPGLKSCLVPALFLYGTEAYGIESVTGN